MSGSRLHRIVDGEDAGVGLPEPVQGWFLRLRLREPPTRLGVNHAREDGLGDIGFLLDTASLSLDVSPVTVGDAHLLCCLRMDIHQWVGVALPYPDSQ